MGVTVSTDKPLAGQLALVTGGLSGIGEAIVERLSRDGARVVVVDLAARGDGSETVVRCDVSNEQDVQRMVEQVISRCGLPDIVVNNAGIYPFIPLATTTYDQWRRVLAVNLDSVFLVCRAFVPAMIERGYGRIVNLATNAFYSGAISDYTAYVASKGGVIGFTRALAAEVGGTGITVNAVAPGLVDNHAVDAIPPDTLATIIAATPAGRLAAVADVAGAVAYLARPDSEFFTGQTLALDGGMTRL